MAQLSTVWQAWLWAAGTLAGAVVLALIGHAIVFAVLRRTTKRSKDAIGSLLVRYGRRPTRVVLPLLATALVLPVMPLTPDLVTLIRQLIGLGFIAAFAWLVIALTNVIADYVRGRFRVDARDNLAARQVQTQVTVLHRIAVISIGFLALAVMLMSFPSIQRLGISLFASAGVAGLAVGIAARPALANLIAGVQIALTQPIRIEDAVIVEGEWGWIEEIGTTYVVVRIWDLRRLIVPLSYFIEKPFQNWTRKTADLLGSVYLYVDYTLPVEDLRQELRRVLESSKLWDGKVCVLQVSNTSEHTMELRALMSASDSGSAWDLRCFAREKLIAYLQERYPRSLPRARIDPIGVTDSVGQWSNAS